MWKFEKINYSKRKTLNNLWEWYIINLTNKVSALWIEEWTFKKWDQIIIKKIILKEEKPHHVTFQVKRDWVKINTLEMSWWVFLNNFINHIDKVDIVEKNTSINKNKVEKIINKKD